MTSVSERDPTHTDGGEKSDAFHVYRKPPNGRDTFTFEGRDESQGILGTIAPGEPPIFTAMDLPSAEQRALARLGEEPGDYLYVTDCQQRVRRIVISRKYHAALDRVSVRATVGYAMLVLCFTCLLASSNARLGAWPILAFVAAAAAYAGIVRIGLFNAIEGVVVCEIILILTFIWLDAVSRVPAAR